MTTLENRNFHVAGQKAVVDEPAATQRRRRGNAANAPLHYFSSIEVSIKFDASGLLGNPQ
ncbi:hypothetical protein [Verminephrobacter eiseniae]|uniref:hypothetical protein n=1 Tax=Verminephrobacter eiseniae TaxID=364317 RepID=UPI0022387AAB|nr:hypothetical protein [Verminephrobacter eiseniae]